MSGILYLVPCPIADEGDVWQVLPAANGRIMAQLDYFIVENTRSARRFLSKSGCCRPIDELEFVELNEHSVEGEAIERMMRPVREGRNAGVISEAGVPAVADPGRLVVALAHKWGIKVVPLVGPSSIIMAVMASGLSGQSFAFNGYLPIKEPDRSKTIKRLENRAHSEHQSQLCIEAPYRNIKLMQQILQLCAPQTLLTVACDITSPEEYIHTHTIEQWRAQELPDINKRPAIFIIG